MKFKNEELDEMISEAVSWYLAGMREPCSTYLKFTEAVETRLEELYETERCFIKSQESLMDSQIRIEKLYNSGDLTVAQYYGIVELLRKAEI